MYHYHSSLFSILYGALYASPETDAQALGNTALWSIRSHIQLVLTLQPCTQSCRIKAEIVIVRIKILK